MGLFNKNKVTIHCDNCQKKINDYDFVWINEHKFCQKCAAEIQGGAPNDLIQNGGVLHGQNFESYNYEMNVEDIYFVKNKGTILCGTVKKGAVRHGDTVFVGEKSFTVIGIECSGKLLKEALCGMNIGLLINCLTPHIFKINDVVFGDPHHQKFEHNTAPVENINNDSASYAKDNEVPALNPEETSLLKRYALKFLPEKMGSPADYKSVIDCISKAIPTINVSVMDFKLQNVFQTNSFGSFSIGDIYYMVASEIEKWLGVTSEEKIMESIKLLDNDSIVATWISLDMFGVALKDNQRSAIDKFCNALLGIVSQRGIKAPQPPVEQTTAGDATDEKSSNLKNTFSTPPVAETPVAETPVAEASVAEAPVDEKKSELELLIDKCCELSSRLPNSAETANHKAELGKMLMQQDEIWVAYDRDFKNIYPYVSMNGRMEIFTKEEYAYNAKDDFASLGNGHFKVVKISNEKIKEFFENALYMGILYFNLDSSVTNFDISIDSFYPYEGEAYLDRYNRIIRSSFMRYMQLLYRYNKISDNNIKNQYTQDYKTMMSALVSGGTTALANGISYILTPDKHIDGVTLYTPDAYNKLKLNQEKLGVNDEKYMLSKGDTNYGTVDGLSVVETVKLASNEEFVAVFTDKESADKLRLDFAKLGPEYDYNVIAVTFDEIVKYAMQCRGIIVDASSYGYIINNDFLNEILMQISNQRK